MLSAKEFRYSPAYIADKIIQFNIYATVAQLVEQLIRNQQVAGSSPASSSINSLKRGSQASFLLALSLFSACLARFLRLLAPFQRVDPQTRFNTPGQQVTPFSRFIYS